MLDPEPRQRGRYRLHPVVDEVTRRRNGDANPRGRLERNPGPFILRNDLTGPGEISLDDAFDLIYADWSRQIDNGNIGAEIIAAYQKDLRGLRSLLAAHSVSRLAGVTPNVVLVWCQMRQPSRPEPTLNTIYKRRSAAKSFFETAKCLGLTDANPAKHIELESRSDRYVHPYTDGQIRQLKQTSQVVLGDTRTPAALAIVMSGATTQELAFITVDDIDLAQRRFWASGGGYRCRDRWVPFRDDWCADAVTARVRELRAAYGAQAGGVWLVYRPHPSQPSPTRQKSAGNGVITRLMKKARVHTAGVTRAESIREWLALRLFEETGSIEQVAVRLGVASLDAVAHLVGYDWVAEHDTDDPAPLHRQQAES